MVVEDREIKEYAEKAQRAIGAIAGRMKLPERIVALGKEYFTVHHVNYLPDVAWAQEGNIAARGTSQVEWDGFYGLTAENSLGDIAELCDEDSSMGIVCMDDNMEEIRKYASESNYTWEDIESGHVKFRIDTRTLEVYDKHPVIEMSFLDGTVLQRYLGEQKN